MVLLTKRAVPTSNKIIPYTITIRSNNPKKPNAQKRCDNVDELTPDDPHKRTLDMATDVCRLLIAGSVGVGDHSCYRPSRRHFQLHLAAYRRTAL